jgi:hypothetical protein
MKKLPMYLHALTVLYAVIMLFVTKETTYVLVAVLAAECFFYERKTQTLTKE